MLQECHLIREFECNRKDWILCKEKNRKQSWTLTEIHIIGSSNNDSNITPKALNIKNKDCANILFKTYS